MHHGLPCDAPAPLVLHRLHLSAIYSLSNSAQLVSGERNSRPRPHCHPATLPPGAAPTCELRLPGVRSVREALSLLRPAIRRAVPAEEPASAAKRAALGALLESGLHQRGSGDAFWQEGIHMAHVGVKLLKVSRRISVLRMSARHWFAARWQPRFD